MAGLFQRIAQNYRKKKKLHSRLQGCMQKKIKQNTQEKWCVLRKGYIVKWKRRFLLSQIDEFREKAKQLQNLLTSKESKVQELQNLVNEREDKAQELEQILSERQEEADEIVSDFSKK